jgi:quinol monooxygenase YgiN
LTATTSKKIANFWRSVALPEHLDEAIAIFEDLINLYRTDEPGTEIYSIHLEPPTTIWLYALFDDQDALDEHRRQNAANPRFQPDQFRQLFSEYGMPHFAGEIVSSAPGREP